MLPKHVSRRRSWSVFLEHVNTCTPLPPRPTPPPPNWQPLSGPRCHGYRDRPARVDSAAHRTPAVRCVARNSSPAQPPSSARLDGSFSLTCLNTKIQKARFPQRQDLRRVGPDRPHSPKPREIRHEKYNNSDNQSVPMETGGKAEHEEDTSSATSSTSDEDLSDETSERSTRAAGEKPAPPNSLALGSEPRKRRLMAPALSLSLGRSESVVSEEFLSAAISPSIDEEEDLGLDLDLDAMETPSDSESLHFPSHDLDLEDDFHRLGVATARPRVRSPVAGPEGSGVGSLEQDQTDSQGTRWRCFTTGEPPQKNRVNMSVLEPYLRVLSHGGYHEDGPDDIIVFSSCYLPDNSVENYQYVMDNLFRYVIGTLELMVSQDYVIVYLCALTQRNKLPAIGWLRECYNAIDRRLRKNLKALYVVHPTWYIKALITIIKPFLSSKFSRKLHFVSSLEDLSQHVPTEGLQIPDGVRQFDKSMSR